MKTNAVSPSFKNLYAVPAVQKRVPPKVKAQVIDTLKDLSEYFSETFSKRPKGAHQRKAAYVKSSYVFNISDKANSATAESIMGNAGVKFMKVV